MVNELELNKRIDIVFQKQCTKQSNSGQKCFCFIFLGGKKRKKGQRGMHVGNYLNCSHHKVHLFELCLLKEKLGRGGTGNDTVLIYLNRSEVK